MIRNPNRLQSVKVQLRPDQIKAMQERGINRHTFIRALIDSALKWKKKQGNKTKESV